jgi:hypothetical protein
MERKEIVFMDALDKEFWIQFIAGFVRKALFATGALLEGYGVFTHDQVTGITTTAVVLFLTGLVVQGIALAWDYAKKNFDDKVLKKAVQIEPPADTNAEVKAAIAEVKAEVKAESKAVASV